MQSKGIALASTALGAALVVFSGCGQPSKRDGDTRATASAAGSGPGSPGTCTRVGPNPFNDPDHPLVCKASGDAAPPAHGVDTDASIVNASLWTFSPTQIGMFGPPFAPMASDGTPTCDAPNAAPTVVDQAGDVRYNDFVFTSSAGADTCVSAYVWDDVPPVPSTKMQLAAYIGMFDPCDIAKNVIAASAPADDIHLSFKVPAGATFEVVVIGAGPVNADGTPKAPGSLGNYHLFVANCGDGSGGGSSSGGSSSGGADDGGTGGKSW